MKACSADGKQLLLYNKNAQYELFKTCPACCRYGNHGYADCYTQCDPSKPPDRDPPEAVAKRDDGPPPSIEAKCSPGTWICDKSKSWTMACTADGIFARTSYCGDGCCKYGSTPGVVFCDCRNREPSPEEQDLTARCPPSSAGCGDPKCNCGSGQRRCDYRGNLLVCIKCQWEIETDCGGPKCCLETGLPGTGAQCSCHRGCCGQKKLRAIHELERSAAPAPAPADDEVLDADKKRNCEYNRLSCNGDYSVLQICNKSGQWVVKQKCGKPGRCIPDGLFGTGAKCA
ncbi:hypothetical protein K491DRAFT_698904 [Lophiostoma macrostomum CBS 122681]|uniref:Uncharacterized protein n=1 Tax=Lophiostoma macrostomum CBS 122681 TaxID=1314788 RepID=A0A6A6SLV4_9PLEO|nr:hypothetical protein K491DRAFT_698904 [Lophiostoma macrostomum CBS 122681]